MDYKPTGKLLGNVPADYIDNDTPTNAAPLSTTQPVGTAMLAWGEGASSLQWNRAFAAVSRNADRLYSMLHTPIAIPMRLTKDDVAALNMGAGPVTTINLAPTGNIDSTYNGWVYHGSNIAKLPMYFKLLDADGTEVLHTDGTPITVTDINFGIGPDPMVPTLISAVDVIKPGAGGTDPRHQITLQAAQTVSQRGTRIRLTSSTPQVAAEGSINGNYIIVDESEDLTSFVLAEYRYRIRCVVIGGVFGAGNTITGSTSGATAILVADGIGVVPADWLEFDSYTPGAGGVLFATGEVIDNGAGATATVVRFSQPGDPALLNNNLNGLCSGQLWTDGNFSRLVTLTFNNNIVGAAERVLLCGGRGFVGDLPMDALLVPFTESAPQPGNFEAEIKEMKGGALGPADWKDPPKNVLGGTTGSSPNAFISLNTAYRHGLALDPADRVAGDGGTITIDGGPVILDGSGSDTAGESLLEVQQSDGQCKGVHVRSDAMSDQGQKALGLVVDSDRNYSGGLGAPASAFEVRVPLFGPNNVVSGNHCSYEYTVGNKYKITFDDADIDLPAFMASSTFANWPDDAVVADISGATDPNLNGIWLIADELAGPPSTFQLKLVDGSGYPADITTTDTGDCTVRFFGRALVGRGYFDSTTGRMLHVAVAQGEEGVVIQRTGSTPSQKALGVLKGASSPTSAMRMMLDDSTNSSDVDYLEATAVHTDILRSQSNPLAGGVPGTTVLDLSVKAAFAVGACMGSGDADITLRNLVSAVRDSLTSHTLNVFSPGNNSLGTDGHIAKLALGGQFNVRARNSSGTMYFEVTDESDQVIAQFYQVADSLTGLKIDSPVSGGNMGNGDIVRLALGNNEVEMAAVGSADGGYPDIFFRRFNGDTTLLKLDQDSGHQTLPTADSPPTTFRRPAVEVPDIRYGSGYTTASKAYSAVGKVVRYEVPILNFRDTVGAFPWSYTWSPLAVTANAGNLSGIILQIPPFCVGSGVNVIKYSNLAGGVFAVGDTIKKVGGAPDYEGQVEAVDAVNGVLYVSSHGMVTLTAAHSIADSTDTVTADIDSVEYKSEADDRTLLGIDLGFTKDNNSVLGVSIYKAVGGGSDTEIGSASYGVGVLTNAKTIIKVTTPAAQAVGTTYYAYIHTTTAGAVSIFNVRSIVRTFALNTAA